MFSFMVQMHPWPLYILDMYVCLWLSCSLIWWSHHSPRPSSRGTLWHPVCATWCHGECVAHFGVVRVTGQIIGVIVPATQELQISEHPVKRVGLSDKRGVFMLCWSAATHGRSTAAPTDRTISSISCSKCIHALSWDRGSKMLYLRYVLCHQEETFFTTGTSNLFIFLPSALELVTARRWRVHKCFLEQTSPWEGKKAVLCVEPSGHDLGVSGLSQPRSAPWAWRFSMNSCKICGEVTGSAGLCMKCHKALWKMKFLLTNWIHQLLMLDSVCIFGSKRLWSWFKRALICPKVQLHSNYPES